MTGVPSFGTKELARTFEAIVYVYIYIYLHSSEEKASCRLARELTDSKNQPFSLEFDLQQTISTGTVACMMRYGTI